MSTPTPSMREAIDRVFAEMERWGYLGQRKCENGAEQFGHVPHVAPLAYLHMRYQPLTPEQLTRMESQVGRPLIAPHRELFGRTNGLTLFSPGLSLYGLQEPFGRDPDRPLPFSLINANTFERPKGTPDDVVFVGGYSADGRKLWMRSGQPEVFVSPRFKPPTTILTRWSSLPIMLMSEVDRLSKLYDPKGVGPKDYMLKAPPEGFIA